jgi:hypothetical protein
MYLSPFCLSSFAFLLSADGGARSSFGTAAKEHENFFYNDTGFLLAMVIANDALFGYESLEDVRKQEIPAGQDELVLGSNVFPIYLSIVQEFSFGTVDPSKMH